MSTEGDYKNPFDEVPDWYDVPELDEYQSNPDFVPPARGGHSALGTVVSSRDTGMSAGRMSSLIWVGIFFVLGGGAVLSLIVGVGLNGLGGNLSLIHI